MRTLVCSLVVATAAFALHSRAMACGGLFCSTTPTAPAPVDQTAERIVFEVDEETITAHIQISYVGEAEEFAWVVPVAAEPEVAESSDAFFDSLDSFSQLQVQLPQSEPCAQPDGGGGGCGCAGDDEAAGTAGDNGAIPRGNVDVRQHDYTDNYEFVVLAAEVTQDLVDWLQENAFNVSDNMTPVMDMYNSPGMLFLAVKLREGRDATDIVPIAMTYAGDLPTIPIRLTAVAAQPLMGILVFILADRPFAPANYERVVPDTDEILFDGAGNTSYFEWVARVADEADGHLWVSEYVGSYAVNNSYLSRYYTRMSPHHMTLDPVFQPVDPSVLQVSNSLDLSSHQTLLSCGTVIQDRVPSACAFNYCGRGATCAESGGTFACECAAGDVAQSITGPDGNRHVTCVPGESPYAVTPDVFGPGGTFDPCNALQCGEGICVLRGGFPTCQCNDNAFASLQTGSVSCHDLPANVQTFGPGAGSESEAAWTPPPPPARMAGWHGTWLPLLFVALALAAWRQRMRAAPRP